MLQSQGNDAKYEMAQRLPMIDFIHDVGRGGSHLLI